MVIFVSMTTDTVAVAHVIVSPPARFGATPPTQLDPEEAFFVPAAGLQAKVAAWAAPHPQHVRTAISCRRLKGKLQVEANFQFSVRAEVTVAADANERGKGAGEGTHVYVDFKSGLTKSSAISYSRHKRK